MTYQFVAGLITMGHLVAGLFFLRFWVRTREGLFAAFAVAFWLLALNQTLLAVTNTVDEENSWIYMIRIASFALIIFAVVKKNFTSR